MLWRRNVQGEWIDDDEDEDDKLGLFVMGVCIFAIVVPIAIAVYTNQLDIIEHSKQTIKNQASIIFK